MELYFYMKGGAVITVDADELRVSRDTKGKIVGCYIKGFDELQIAYLNVRDISAITFLYGCLKSYNINEDEEMETIYGTQTD